MAPCAELRNVLQPAMAPCRHFADVCKTYCAWEPANGHIPRGFGGATGGLGEVKLVLVTAEPGNPASNEHYEPPAETYVERHAALVGDFLEFDGLRRKGRPAPFHRNMRRILDACWPGVSLAEQLRRTWLTDAVLCSAPVSGGQVNQTVEDTCVQTYLAKQIDLLPDAFVVALGGKAERRMQRNDIRIDATAQHPSARSPAQRNASWEAMAAKFRQSHG